MYKKWLVDGNYSGGYVAIHDSWCSTDIGRFIAQRSWFRLLIYAPHVRAQVQFFLETIFDEKTS
jgi:hypothetical protein